MTNKCVLIVEDEADFVVLVRAALRKDHYETVHVRDGQEALSFLKSADIPAAIVLDLCMPDMGGKEFCRELAGDERLGRIPVVLYSCESNLRTMAKELGAAGFVSKFDHPSRVLDEVRRCCS